MTPTPCPTSNATNIRDTSPRGIAFSNDGTKMFILNDGTNRDVVREYNLTSPFDTSILLHVNATGIDESNNYPRGIAFSNDGTKMFILDYVESTLNEYGLTSPFDASTLSFVDATNIGGNNRDPQDIAFSNDGAKMFIVGTDKDLVNEYDLHSVYPITVTGTSTVLPAGAFVTTWNATSSPHTISIPLEVRSSGTITIDWGDGSNTSVAANGTQSHAYSGPGDYQVSMTGDLSRINLGATGATASKLASIDQWGDIEWSSMERAFEDATSMEYNASDAPDLSGVSSMNHTFLHASSFNGDVSSWNVSAVTDMTSMFNSATSFNQPLDSWNVSRVTNMRSMFTSASSFDRPLNSWNVSAVTDMTSMFFGASDFDKPLNSWNVSRVTSMGAMFSGAFAFNQPLDSWNVSGVTDMEFMFSGAFAFNQPLSSWNVSRVTNMGLMFFSATSFDQNLGEWYVIPADTSYDVSEGTLNVTTISAQNAALDGHNPNYGIGSSDDSDLFNMTGNVLMFKATPSAGNYTVDVTAPGGDFGTNNHRVLDVTVTDKDAVPEGAFVTTWNATSSPHTISIPLEVYPGGTITIDWGDGSTDNVTANGTQPHTYSGPGDYQVSITGNLSRIEMSATGGTASKLASIDQWGDIRWSSMERAFEFASNMEYAAIDAPDLSGVTSMERMFQSASKFDWDLSGWNVSAVTNMDAMFGNAAAFNSTLNDWNVSSVTDMNSMFQGATDFNQPLNDWNVSAVTSMANMFNRAAAFNSTLNDWNVSAVTSMERMFSNAAAFNRPLHNWNVSSVNDMRSMFEGATSFNLTLHNWNVSSVKNMAYMFQSATDFNQPLHNWNVSSVTDMKFMFNNAAAFNRPLNDWNVSSVNYMGSMFQSATDFNQPLHNWDVSSVTSMGNMFRWRHGI